MAYLAFARKYRPQTFEDLAGQEHIATTLRNAIRKNRVTHAYLFSGPRGVGKTSAARIFAKSLNCEKGPAEKPCNSCVACQEITRGISLDVLEIDGASNRGIDQIRELRENVKFHATRGQFRIYIIDEVHQITHDGFDALLKTLEEPPAHVKFIFATTEPHKVPPTILSRCQRFEFHRLPAKVIAQKLKAIVGEEKIQIQEEALLAIARSADGSMRDAESLLDQLASGPKSRVELKEVLGALGGVGHDFLMKVAEAIQKKEKLILLQIVDQLVNEGRDLVQFLDELSRHFRNLSVAKLGEEGKALIDLSEDAIEEIYRQAKDFSLEENLYILNLLSRVRLTMKRASLPRVPLEMTLVKLAKRDSLVSLEELVERLETLEKQISAPNADSAARTESVASSRPAEPAKDPAPRRTDASASLGAVGEKWGQLVQEVGSKRKSIGTFLGEGKPIALEGGILTIAFPEKNKFHRETLESPSNRKLIEETLSGIVDQKIGVAFETLQEESAPPLPQVEKPPHDPIVKFSLDVFSGNVIKDE